MGEPLFDSVQKSNSKGDKFNVFIVDDEHSSLSALGHRLEKENSSRGYNIYCFTTGEDCVKHLWLQPHLIIMDEYLVCEGEGSLCGAQLLRTIKKINSDIPMVVISGKHKPKESLLAEEEGTYYMVRDVVAYESVQKILRMISL